MLSDKAVVIQQVCDALYEGNKQRASTLAKDGYPFLPRARSRRNYTENQSLQVFLRDGFIDRYTNAKLVFPAVLRLLAQELPEEFPAHPHWKMDESHIVFWELNPTVDHLVPIARGGEDFLDNWVCTSMLSNQSKSNWTLEELGWKLHPPGKLSEWDGLTNWFLAYVNESPDRISSPYLQKWHRALMRATV